MKRGACRFFLAFTVSALALSPAFAEESQENGIKRIRAQQEESERMGPEQPAPEQAETEQAKLESIPLADLEKAESLGLFTKSGDGGLGKDLWKGARRSDLVVLIPAMPATAQDRAVQRIIFGALLTAADASAIENDVPPEAGNDLLTLRLEKLLEGGAYKQALDLYSQLKEGPYHPRLANAGVLAMLFSGQKSTACLEANAVRENFPEDDLISEVITYCDTSMAEGAAAPATHRYMPGGFGKLPQLDRALVAADNKLAFVDFDAKEIAAVPAADIQIVLQSTALSEEQKLALTARGVEFGLISSAQLADLYTQSAAPAAGGEGATNTGPVPENDWAKIAYFYNFATGAAEEDQWPILQQVLGLRRELGAGALSPFAALLSKIEPKNASIEEITAAAIVMNNSGIALPSGWLRAIDTHSDNAGQKDAYGLLKAIAYITDSNGKNSSGGLKELQSALASARPEYQLFVNNIIENIDKDRETATNTHNAYEKEISLTFSKDYVMPSVSVWDRAIKASQAKAKAETILLSTVLLRDRTLRDVYPGLLRDVLQSFENVGLTDISEDMAITALLGNIE